MSRHPLDLVSLLFGAVFTAIGVVYLIPTIGLRALWSPQLWPALLVVVGLWLIASTMRRRSRSEDGPAPGNDDSADAHRASQDPADAHSVSTDPADAHSPSQDSASHTRSTSRDTSADDEATAAEAGQEPSARSQET